MTEETTKETPHEILPLVKSTDPILFSKMESFNFSNPPIDPIYLTNCLIATMNHHNGIGLSANQCGIPLRVFVMRSEAVPVCFNPRIVELSKDIIPMDEGCLSFPFLYLKVKRPSWVRARFTNAFGETKTETFGGLSARCFLHEYHHLEGISFTQLVNIASLDRAKRQAEKIKKRLKPAKDYAYV